MKIHQLILQHSQQAKENPRAKKMKKRRRNRRSESHSIDRISSLPDSILQHILSFLPVNDFVKTSVLSKRWRSVWAEVPVLCFDYSPDETVPRFERFVTNALSNYSGNKVQKLHISFWNENSISSAVDDWVRFATERKVEVLDLFIVPKIQFLLRLDHYQLPQSIYSNSSLQVLDTKRCDLKPLLGVSWTSLKVLSLANANLSHDSIARILLGSPNLECLRMNLFEGVEKISVTSSNMKLKELVLEDWLVSRLEISAPHLHSLTLIGCTRGRRIELINLSSLVEFNLDVFWRESVIGCELPRVQKLRIGSGTLELRSKFKKLTFPLALNCKSLVVDSSVKEWDFQGIVTLLQATPNLEKLKVMMKSFNWYKFVDKTEYWESLKTDVECNHLTTVLISGFDRRWFVGSRLKFFTSMVEFLLKNATVLKKMVIYAQSEETMEAYKKHRLPNLSKVKKLISSYPRASVVAFKTNLD